MSKRNLYERAVAAFDLPGEVLVGMSRMTVTGNNRVFIECHKGIVEYNAQVIVVDGGTVFVKIRGEDLALVSMNASELLIEGMITGIDFY